MRSLGLQLLPSPGHLEVAIVVDVLRMTTTACAMLAAGAAELVVVADDEAARSEAARSQALLFGERGGVALAGFDGGNSPLELAALPIAGRRAVVCTTNGSKAVEAAVGGAHLLLGAIVNAPAVAARALALAKVSVTLVCAGTEGRVSFDDVLAAGHVLRELTGLDGDLRPSDAALLALELAAAYPDPLPGLQRSAHGRTLVELGFGDDLAYAGQVGALQVVPERRAGAPPTFTACTG